MSVTEFASVSIMAFILSIIPALVIFYLLRKGGTLANVSYKYFFIPAGLIFLGLIVVGVASTFFYSDFENLLEQKRRANEEFSARTQEAMKEKAAEREREAEEISGDFGDETESGRLKYRPHWLVGEDWAEKERNGLIEKSRGCADIVTIISRTSGDLDTQKFWYNSWLEECVRG